MSDTLKSILDKIKNDVKKIVAKDEVDLIKNKELNHIESDVYEKYTPTEYERRYENNGLKDKNNIKEQLKTNNNNIELTITNETKGRRKDSNGSYYKVDKRIDEVIERGIRYEWEESKIYRAQPYPRPYTKNTTDELNNTKEHIKLLKEKLKNKGYSIE